MYADWASLQDEIQYDQTNKSVLHKFPNTVGRDVACTVVKHIAQNLSISVSSCEPSDLETDSDVKWTMEVNKYIFYLIKSDCVLSLFWLCILSFTFIMFMHLFPSGVMLWA